MKTIGNMRKLFLLLALIVAGVQSASADIYKYERDTVIMNGVYYETNFLVYNYSLSGSNNFYDASIIHLLTAGTSLSVPSEITIDNKAYKVRYVGKHTYLKGYPTRYFFDSSVPTNPGWKSEWKDNTGYHSGSSGALDTDWEYSAVPVNNSNSGLKNLTFQGAIEIYGPFTSNSLETLNFQGDATIKGDMLVVGLRNLNLNGALDISGTLTSDRLTEIHFNNLTCSGKFECSSLTDVYFPALKNEWVLFSGNVFTGVSFSGSQWEDHFPSSLKKKIRAHVWDLTSEQLAKLKNSAIWCDFKEIVNHKSNVNYTIVSDGNARIDFVELKGNASYVSATGISQIASASSGSKSGSVKSGGNYAVEIRDVDFDTKNVQLLRNGHVATLEPYEDQGQPIRYYEDLDLQQDVRYEVSVSDKVCTVSFAQTGYTGRIMYQKTWNGTTSTGVITAYAPTVTCAQGSQLKLTIPYDQYTPNVLRLNGSTVSMTKANGEATATITVPAAATAEVDLTWQAPQQTYTSHQPQIMILRSGEGQVVFKGAICLPSDEWSQYLDDYEQSGLLLSGRDGYETWVMTGNGPVSCTQTVTNVTAPDVDPRGEDSLDEGCWGFIIEITPVAGQKLKTLLLGRISGNELSWEDMVSEGYSNGSYVTYDASTNTYTFDIRGDYMNFGVGDYVVNIAMGPEETAVETGKTLNFVRQGGRGDSFIEWYDESGRDFYFEEGSTSKTIPNEELQDDDLKMYIDIEEGEVLHVYKNGADITSQFQLNGQSTTQYWAPLEEESATYTLLIDDAPDANPTWTIHNATEADVVVEQTLKDGTTTTTTFAGNLNDLVIDDTQVSKVTLKVYAENANEAKPVRVLVNGQDVSYQFSTMPNDGDGFRLCYEVPVSELTNCSWDISYNTDHQQTFVVKGGSRELLVDFEREILYGGPVFSIFRNDGPATIYLPPFNSEYNSNIDMVVYANAGEGVTIKRNGVDVTALFEEKAASGYKYYDLDINDADFEGDNTVSQFGFDIRDAAVWEITIEEPLKMLNAYANNDVIVSIAKLVDGEQPTFAGRENAIHRWINVGETCEVRFVPQHNENLTRFDIGWNSIDIENESRLVKNDDGSYSFTITYDEINEKTFDILAVFSGGTNDDNAVEYLFIGDFNQVYASADLNDEVQYNGYEFFKQDVSEFYIDKVVENEMAANQSATLEFELPNANATGRVFRNGVDLTDQFVNNNGNYYPKEELRSLLHEPAHWVVINESDLMKYDVNRDNKVDISDVTKLVNKVLNR